MDSFLQATLPNSDDFSCGEILQSAGVVVKRYVYQPIRTFPLALELHPIMFYNLKAAQQDQIPCGQPSSQMVLLFFPLYLSFHSGNYIFLPLLPSLVGSCQVNSVNVLVNGVN